MQDCEDTIEKAREDAEAQGFDFESFTLSMNAYGAAPGGNQGGIVKLIIGNGKPLGPGMAVVWGAGLGFSGLLVVELMGERVMAMLREDHLFDADRAMARRGRDD